MSDDILPPLTRDDLIEMAQVACAVMDNPNRAESARLGAAKMYAECSHDLLFTNQEPFIFVPLTLRIRNWYQDTLESVLARLCDEDLNARQRISILLARKAAVIADNTEFSGEMRCDADNAFRAAVDGIRDGDPTLLCW